MPVFRWGQSWSAFRDLEREVDRMLRGVNLSVASLRPGRQFPPINLYERDEEYLLTAELPGMKAEDLELTLAGGILTLSGDRLDPADVHEDQFRRRERFQGSWQRSVTVPDRVDEEQLTADFNHGILQVHLPKLNEARPRQIPVQKGGES